MVPGAGRMQTPTSAPQHHVTMPAAPGPRMRLDWRRGAALRDGFGYGPQFERTCTIKSGSAGSLVSKWTA